MAKMGRPKKDIKKEKVISLRLTDEIYQKLLAYISKRIIQSEMSAGSLLVNNERRSIYGKST